MDLRTAVRTVAERTRVAGGRALVVGGAVRDRLLGLQPQDYDVELFGIAPDKVVELARGVGVVHDVGRAFGILECRLMDGILHLSLPRREAKIAPGHRGFSVGTDPTMSPAEAARRRDFTINAIADDPLTGELLDPFHGQADLAAKLLRVADPRTFGDDPLRVLRGAVFAAQFALQVDAETDAVMKNTVSSLRELPKSRVGGEWRKLLLRPERPSVGLALLMDWGALSVLHPDFVKLPDTPQNPKWHPEGDVWIHTKMAVDEAASITREHGLVTDERWRVLVATLCHDLGKATTTVWERGAWRSPGHDAAGVEPTQRFLRSVSADRRTTGIVVPIVREHLVPLRQSQAAARGTPVADGGIRQLARRLHPATIFLLTLVSDADLRGRGQLSAHFRSGEVGAGARLRERAERLDVLVRPPLSVLHGADLLSIGIPPGPAFGSILRRAEQLRDERGETTETLLERLQGASSSDDALRRLS